MNKKISIITFETTTTRIISMIIINREMKKIIEAVQIVVVTVINPNLYHPHWQPWRLESSPPGMSPLWIDAPAQPVETLHLAAVAALPPAAVYHSKKGPEL